jgi:hypothetical protein
MSWRWLAVVAFAAWVLVVGTCHEAWFDEAQAWSMARDSSLWQLLAQRVRYDGTPGLWHAILWFAIRLGLPFRFVFLLPATFAIVGAAVILWRAPFPPALRVAVLTSYFYGYQFSVIARSYCLDLALMPLLAIWFADRRRRPVRYAVAIGLLANTNAFGFVAGGVLGLELAWRIVTARRSGDGSARIALGLAAMLGLFAMVCAWQPADNAFLNPDSHDNPIVKLSTFLCDGFIDHLALWNPTLVSKFDVFVCVLLTLVLQRPILVLIAAGSNQVMALALVASQLVFAAKIYANMWHAGIFFLLWIFLLWINWANPISPGNRRQLLAAMGIILSFQTVETAITGWWDIGHPYSSGPQAAKIIAEWRSTHPSGRIYGYGDMVFAIPPWLDGNPFANYHDGDKHVSYLRWDRREPWMKGVSLQRTRLDFWHKVLAAKPDMIVASPVNRNWSLGYEVDLAPSACSAGYALRAVLPGTMIWRGRPASDQRLLFFESATSGPCARMQ